MMLGTKGWREKSDGRCIRALQSLRVDFPGGPVAKTLRSQRRVQVPSLVRELEPT